MTVQAVQASASFDVPSRVLYDSLLDSADMSKMTRSPCQVRPVVGSEWSIFNGTVSGVVQSLEEGRRIELSWRFSSWPEGQTSNVVIALDPLHDESSTRITVHQTGIPSHDKFGIGDQDVQCKVS